MPLFGNGYTRMKWTGKTNERVLRDNMPPSSYHSMFELLLRHGVEESQAKVISMNDLRHWEPKTVDRIFSKIKRLSADSCPFLEETSSAPDLATKFRDWWPGAWVSNPQWISPARSMMHDAVKKEGALCVNIWGEWSIKHSGYMAVSHVWLEGLQRCYKHDGVELSKIHRIFSTLKKANINTEWVWTDVLAIPATRGPVGSLEDDMLKVDVINTLHKIYTNADAVVIFDALALQLESYDCLEAAVLLRCGKWMSRVWTFQEANLAERALIVTKHTHHTLKDVVNRLFRLQKDDEAQYRPLWRAYVVLARTDSMRISPTDIALTCNGRRTGNDIDYARAFFPLLGLTWEYGMTREQGMQMIYRNRRENATRLLTFFGAPCLSISPAWAPSYLTGLQGGARTQMDWERRGVRGHWYVVKLTDFRRVLARGKGVKALEFTAAGISVDSLQITILQKDFETVLEAMKTAISMDALFLLSDRDLPEHGHEFSKTVVIVKGAKLEDDSCFEAAVLCTALLMSNAQYNVMLRTQKLSILLRHISPYVDSDRENEMYYALEEVSEKAGKVR